MQFAPFSFFNAGGALPPFPVTSGSVFLLTYNEYTNGSTWPTINGPLQVVNSPLVGQGPDGFWQLDGANDYISASNDPIVANFAQVSSSNYEDAPFTIHYYGTIGDLTTRRALAGNPAYNVPTDGTRRGTDIIVRTDTSPGTGKASIDLRTGEALGGQFYRFTVDYTSGSIFDIAIVWDNNQSASCYQNGVQTAISGNVGWQGPSFFQTGSPSVPAQINKFNFFYNNDVDADNWNGQVGAVAVWNRALDSTEISQSSAYFTANL